ncbi:hypothetical protein H7Y21_01135 [Arenimonas sp.]|nr:hypothetical protein [Candidatus Parcubacteria bacterium]
MKNKKIIAFLVLLIVTVTVIKFTYSIRNSVKSESKIVTIKPPVPTPAPTPPQPVISNGWKFDSKGVDYEWQIPTTPPTEPTAWLNLDHNFNYRQRIKEDCIVEYDAGGTKKAMKYEVQSEQVYLRGEDGVISTSPWDRKDFDAYRLTTTAVRFIPYEGKPLSLKMGRKE